MEKTNKNPQQLMPAKAMVAVGGGIVGLIGVYLLGQQFGMLVGISQYTSPTPQLNEKYRVMREAQNAEYMELVIRHTREICEAEKEIARSKWRDAEHGVAEDGANWIQLRMKADRDCTSIVPPTVNDGVDQVATPIPSTPSVGLNLIPTANAAISYDGEHMEFLPPSTPNLPPPPKFASWKGETANEMLASFWEVSGGDWDFIKTMAGENGSFDPYLKHPIKNKNGTRDYSFGLNDRYHMPFIQKILKKEVSLTEIAQYHYDIYVNGGPTKCGGPTPFCAYPKRNSDKIKKLFI